MFSLQRTSILGKIESRRTYCQMKEELVIVIIFALGEIGMARAQSAIDMLQPLAGTSARRLAIAEQVALAKWDSRAAVEDAAREAQVIMAAAKYGKSRGLDATFVSNCFYHPDRGQQVDSVFPVGRLASHRQSANAQAGRFGRCPPGTGSTANRTNRRTRGHGAYPCDGDMPGGHREGRREISDRSWPS
jgi:chorismate mutase